MNSRISIIVPVYKVEAYLDQCVQSIVDQTYTDLEIILVDDGSPDNCPAMCDAWAEKDSRIKVIHKGNGGIADARNAGLTNATGEYIGFVDSDDYIAPDMYEILISKMQKDDCDIAVGQIYPTVSSEYPKHYKIGKSYTFSSLEAISFFIERPLDNACWNKLYRRSLFSGVCFPQLRTGEDVGTVYSLLAIARKICVDYNAVYFYRQRDNSMIHKMTLYSLDELQGLSQRVDIIVENYPLLTSKAKIFLYACASKLAEGALREFSKEDQKIAFTRIKSIIDLYPLTGDDYRSFSPSKRVWAFMMSVSLEKSCRLRHWVYTLIKK